MNNYRINFGGSEIDYKNNFEKVEVYFPILVDILLYLEVEGIEDKWHFFEPYVELTWISPFEDREKNNFIVNKVLEILLKHHIVPTLIHLPENGNVTDWYGHSVLEREFGYKSYSLSTKMFLLFWIYREHINNGCGKRNQYVRRAHVLANQLGFNYQEESNLLAKRADLCNLFFNYDHKTAVKMYEEKYKEKYR